MVNLASIDFDNVKSTSRTNSTWQNRADLSIAHGALTNSKRPESLVKGVYPTHLTRGQGAYVWDTDGKKYVDFICGLGSSILGYGNEEIAEAIYLRAKQGTVLSLGTDLEVKVAERVKELFPFIDLLRFLKTGTDACNAAIRIARTYTNRSLVLSEGYHGWGDDFVRLTPPALGVPLAYSSEKLSPDLSNITPDVAAVIIEPINTDNSTERVEWLRLLREKCTKTGTVLIFDEVITGFRFPRLSVSQYYGITPDLICLGKAMANGLPISVVGGKRNIMNCDQYFVSSTFAGDTVSLTAAQKTMQLITTKHSVDQLWESGKRFIQVFNTFHDGLKIEGYSTRGIFKGDEMVKALFFQEACKAGFLFGPSFFFNFAHISLSDQVLNSCRDILLRIKTGSVKLQGELPKTPFAQKVRTK